MANGKEFKMDYGSIGNYSDYMYNIIGKILNDIGPRAPCSLEEKKAAELVQAELKQWCDTVHMEDFTCYPRAFLGWIRIDVFSLIAAFFLFLLSPFQPIVFAIIPLALSVFAVLCFYKQFFRYEEWTPKFLPYKLGHSQNVIGTFKPTGEVKKRIIFSGHLDSAFKFNLSQHTKAGYAYFYFAGVLVLISFVVLYLVQTILVIASIPSADCGALFTWIAFFEPLFMAVFFLVIGKNDKVLYGALHDLNTTAKVIIWANTAYTILVFVLLFPFLFVPPSIQNAATLAILVNIVPIIALIFFAGRKAIPGALDNLTAVAVCLCIGKILGEWREKYPEKYPKNTEVQVTIVGCEEVGLRGSQAFATAHAAEYNKIDTTCVNMESIDDSSNVKIYTKEATTGTILTPEVYNLLDQCATELGISHTIEVMPGVSGGTDAAGLVRGGLKASSLCGLNYKDYLAYNHTDRDNIDLLNKKRRPWSDNGTTWQDRNIRGAMEQSLCICMKYLEKKEVQ